MTDTDRLVETVRQFPGMRASAAFHRAGLRLRNNYRATLVFNARRDGLLAPSVKGENWGRLYPVQNALEVGSIGSASVDSADVLPLEGGCPFVDSRSNLGGVL